MNARAPAGRWHARLARPATVLAIAAISLNPFGGRSAAEPDSAPLRALPYEVTLEAGQSYRTEALLFCVDYGRPFPADLEPVAYRINDAAVKVIQQMVESDVITNAVAARGQIPTVYQVQLAIWQSLDGDFRDFAGRNVKLAERLSNASFVQKVPSMPRNAVFSPDLAGEIETVFSDVEPIVDAQAGGEPYAGTAAMEVRNLTGRRIKVMIIPGAVARSARGDADQRVLVVPQHRGRLPASGGDVLPQELAGPAVLILSGAALLGVGVYVLIRRRRLGA